MYQKKLKPYYLKLYKKISKFLYKLQLFNRNIYFFLKKIIWIHIFFSRMNNYWNHGSHAGRCSTNWNFVTLCICVCTQFLWQYAQFLFMLQSLLFQGFLYTVFQVLSPYSSKTTHNYKKEKEKLVKHHINFEGNVLERANYSNVFSFFFLRKRYTS